MSKSSPRFTSRRVNWSDTRAGGFAIAHLSLGGYLVSTLLINFELNDLLLNDFKGFMVVIGLAVAVTVTTVGILVIYFVAQADVKDSVRYARYSFWLAVAYLCFCVGVVGVSWTFLIGYAFVSLVYFVEAIVLLAIACRTFRELRAVENWTSIR